MSYRLPDPPADTPRTNAEERASDPDCYGQIRRLVGSRFARELERELNAALAEIATVRADLAAFFALLDIEEETDDGRVFKPNQLGGSCRALDAAKMNELLGRLKEFATAP